MKFIKAWWAKRQKRKWLEDVSILRQEYELYRWAHGARVPDSLSKPFEKKANLLKSKLDLVLKDNI